MTTTSTPVSLNGQSSDIRWIITGAVVGSVLALGAVLSIMALLLTCRKRTKKEQKWEQSNNSSNAQDSTLLAPYHLVNGTTAVDNNLHVWKDASGTPGIESTLNKTYSETADSAAIQLTQNVAYQGWNKNRVIDGYDSGYVILDPSTNDSQMGGFSTRYSNSIVGDYDYI